MTGSILWPRDVSWAHGRPSLILSPEGRLTKLQGFADLGGRPDAVAEGLGDLTARLAAALADAPDAKPIRRVQARADASFDRSAQIARAAGAPDAAQSLTP